MCNNPNWEPIEFARNGSMDKMSGIAIDTLRVLEKKLEIEFINVPTKNWSQSQQFLKDKKCDILPAAIKTAKREEYAKFTKPYMNYKLAIITKKNASYIESLEDIIDKTMSRKKGSGLINKLKNKYPNINILETKNYLESLKSVENGDVYFTIATLPVASYYIAKFALYDLHIAGYTDMTYSLSIAVRDDKAILANILDKALNDIDVAQYKSINNKWINYKIEESFINYEILRNILIIIFIIVVLFLYRQNMLKKANNELVIQVANQTRKLKIINENLEQEIKIEVEKVKKIENKFFESKKLAAMGEMIGNIAHQWRQPLSLISTVSTGVIMKKELGILSDEDLLKDMNIINDSAQYLSKTIDDFRDLIKGDVEIEKFNLNDNISKCLLIQSPMLKVNNIELIQDLDKTIFIYSYPNALIQCMINIINNSKDALNEHQTNKKYIFIKTYLVEDNAIIEIQDNAYGIDKNILPHIFEAYFTTKHKSIGTGLGLNMTYKMIVKDMKGKIEASNVEYKYNDKLCKGALFKVILPLNLDK